MSVVQAVSLPLKIIAIPFLEIKKILFYHPTYNRYVKLQNDYARLQKSFISQSELSAENARLRELLDFKQRLTYPSLAAHVVGRDPSSWTSSIVIDRGKNHGLKVGLPVVNASGVIGKVTEVGATMSRVILLTDPNFSVGAIVERTRDNGLVSGTLQGFCRMEYVAADAQVKEGDQVVTSQLSYSFPEGFLLGVIRRVEESQSNPTLECLLEPAVNFSQLEEVLVLLTWR